MPGRLFPRGEGISRDKRASMRGANVLRLCMVTFTLVSLLAVGTVTCTPIHVVHGVGDIRAFQEGTPSERPETGEVPAPSDISVSNSRFSAGFVINTGLLNETENILDAMNETSNIISENGNSSTSMGIILELDWILEFPCTSGKYPLITRRWDDSVVENILRRAESIGISMMLSLGLDSRNQDTGVNEFENSSLEEVLHWWAGNVTSLIGNLVRDAKINTTGTITGVEIAVAGMVGSFLTSEESVKEFAQVFNNISYEIRREIPDVKIIAPGFSQPQDHVDGERATITRNFRRFLDVFFQEANISLLDGISFKFTGTPQNFERAINKVVGILERPLFLTRLRLVPSSFALKRLDFKEIDNACMGNDGTGTLDPGAGGQDMIAVRLEPGDLLKCHLLARAAGVSLFGVDLVGTPNGAPLIQASQGKSSIAFTSFFQAFISMENLLSGKNPGNDLLNFDLVRDGDLQLFLFTGSQGESLLAFWNRYPATRKTFTIYFDTPQPFSLFAVPRIGIDGDSTLTPWTTPGNAIDLYRQFSSEYSPTILLIAHQGPMFNLGIKQVLPATLHVFLFPTLLALAWGLLAASRATGIKKKPAR